LFRGYDPVGVLNARLPRRPAIRSIVLLFVGVGLFGVLSFSVAQRTRQSACDPPLAAHVQHRDAGVASGPLDCQRQTGRRNEDGTHGVQ
jgi:hypothetical protein